MQNTTKGQKTDQTAQFETGETPATSPSGADGREHAASHRGGEAVRQGESPARDDDEAFEVDNPDIRKDH